MKKKHLFIFFYCVTILKVNAQDSLFSNVPSSELWLSIAEGLEYCELNGPYKSILGDSKISILRFEPNLVESKLLAASQFQIQPKTVAEWADSFGLDVVINAGMYQNASKLMNHAYMKVGNHINNPNIKPMNNAVIVLDPKQENKPNLDIIDLSCKNWNDVHFNFSSCIQGVRMIDCYGNPILWSKSKLPCSMLVCAKDNKGRIYFIFNQSNYTQNDMIQYLVSLPFELNSAIYMEGGPETSFYLKTGIYRVMKAGNYVSKSIPPKINDHFWPLPNVIGLRVKKN
jgi:hypothetical protein